MKARPFDSSIASTAQEALDFIANILESSTEYSVIGKDLDGKTLLWNEGARRLYSYEPEEAVGQANSAILHAPEDVASGKPRELLDAALRDGKWEGTIHRRRKNGEQFTTRSKTGRETVVSCKATTINDEAGKLQGVFAAARAVTERKGFDQTFQEKNVELEDASLAKDRFLASMRHELRTPLNAIVGFTGTLPMKLPGPLREEQEEQLRTIQASSRHLPSVINDLPDRAKIESGKVELNAETLDCRSVIEDVSATSRPLAEGKGLKFEIRIPSEGLLVQTDGRSLTQILINLANNAIKFANKGPIRIELGERRDNGHALAEIAVVDTGMGIRDEDKAKFFAAFMQVDSSSTRAYVGAGPGLHVSQQPAHMIGGPIRFERVHGKGSTFFISVPVAEEVVRQGS